MSDNERDFSDNSSIQSEYDYVDEIISDKEDAVEEDKNEEEKNKTEKIDIEDIIRCFSCSKELKLDNCVYRNKHYCSVCIIKTNRNSSVQQFISDKQFKVFWRGKYIQDCSNDQKIKISD